MSQPLRKTILIPLPDEAEPVSVDITMRSLEVIERVWNKGLDSVIVELSNAATVKRYLIADVIAQWVPLGSSKFTSSAIKEAVMLAPAEKFSMYAGLVLLVASYALHYVGEDDFKRGSEALAGRLKPGPEAAIASPKKVRRRSSKVATKS